jgi:hypothetical protein
MHVNVFHFARRDNQSVTEANLDDLEANLSANMAAEYRGLFYDDQVSFRVDITSVYGTEKIGKVYVWLGGTRDPDGSDTLPNFVALKMKWLSGYRERRFNGRSYFGGLREQDNTNGSPSSTYQVIVNQFEAAMQGYFDQESGGYVFVILSDPDGLLPTNVAGPGQRLAKAAGVTDAEYYGDLVTLRRRLPGVGD